MLVNAWNIVNKRNQVEAKFQYDTVRLGYLGGT